MYVHKLRSGNKICGQFDNLAWMYTIKVVFFACFNQKSRQKAWRLNFLCNFAAYLTENGVTTRELGYKSKEIFNLKYDLYD